MKRTRNFKGRTFKEKPCRLCSKNYVPTSTHQFYCEYCKKEGKRIRDTRWSKENKERAMAFLKKYPEKTRTREKTRRLIKSGKMAQLACEVCGNFLSEAHHSDYNNPKDVWFLCRKHHRLVDFGKLVLYE